MYLENPTVNAVVCSVEQLLSDLIKTLDCSVVCGSSHCSATVYILVGESATLDIPALIDVLSQQTIEFIGAIVPAVISGTVKSTTGVIINALPTLGKPYLIRGLEQPEIDLPELDPDGLDALEQQATALLLVDGLTANIGTFLAELYDDLGNSVHYLGGGAGSLSLQQKPCIFNSEGCFQDAALVTFVALSSSLGVRHGWERIHGPVVATQTEKNRVQQLNWKNAFSVYRDVVEQDSDQTLTRDNFFEIAKGYPFGILKAGQEDIVRDPIIVQDEKTLVCVGEVPENASLHILKGSHASLTTAARQAASDSASQIDPKHQVHSVMIVDCISRVLFLEENFLQELDALQKGLGALGEHLIPEGALTLGEISSYGEGFLEFFNKTIVVGTLYS